MIQRQTEFNDVKGSACRLKFSIDPKYMCTSLVVHKFMLTFAHPSSVKSDSSVFSLFTFINSRWQIHSSIMRNKIIIILSLTYNTHILVHYSYNHILVHTHTTYHTWTYMLQSYTRTIWQFHVNSSSNFIVITHFNTNALFFFSLWRIKLLQWNMSNLLILKGVDFRSGWLKENISRQINMYMKCGLIRARTIHQFFTCNKILEAMTTSWHPHCHKQIMTWSRHCMQ
jgi:hypothetical protein